MQDWNVSFKGRVIKGKQVGRTIGFPTANLEVNAHPFLSLGVYGVKVICNRQLYDGILNIGRRPTFKDGDSISYEVNIFDFDKSIYGEYVRITICFFVREEKKFPSVPLLISQINKDIDTVKKRMTLENVDHYSSITVLEGNGR